MSWASLAHADAKKDIEALVAKNVAAVAADRGDLFVETELKDAVTVLPVGYSLDFRSNFYGLIGTSNIRSKVDKLTVVVDDANHAAWFHGVVNSTYSGGPMTFRISGVALDDHGWKIAAIMWAAAIPDKQLLASPSDKGEPGDPALYDNVAVAKQVGQWFGTGLAAHAATGAIASGTAPNEYQTGGGVAALVKGWDKLKLVADKVDVHTWAGDKIGFASGVVELPVGKDKIVPMNFGTVLVPADGAWQWSSPSFFHDSQ